LGSSRIVVNQVAQQLKARPVDVCKPQDQQAAMGKAMSAACAIARQVALPAIATKAKPLAQRDKACNTPALATTPPAT